MTPKSSMQFDLDKALEELRAGKPMSSKDGFLTLLIKQPTEAPKRRCKPNRKPT